MFIFVFYLKYGIIQLMKTQILSLVRVWTVAMEKLIYQNYLATINTYIKEIKIQKIIGKGNIYFIWNSKYSILVSSSYLILVFKLLFLKLSSI